MDQETIASYKSSVLHEKLLNKKENLQNGRLTI